MKISKFTATDMRQALRQVRAELGPDAVILASRAVEKGIEITAAIDFDAPMAGAAAGVAAAPSAAPAAFSPQEFQEILAKTQEQPAAAAASDVLGAELKSLRRILETQVAQLAWNDLTRRAPIHTEILRELTEIGIAPDFAAQIVAQLPPNIDLALAHRCAIAMISQALPVTGDKWLDDGGCIALIGPTGVGKSTTLAKLAVRWALRHGSRELALVSADSVRIGAHDPMRALGQMLGAQVSIADNFAELPAVLERLKGRRLILIDTPGLSQRDPELETRLAELTASREIQTTLVLAASTQAGAIEEIVTRFALAKPASCVLTKVDEAASLGGALSILTRHRLAVAYVSEGQRVPEDLRPARALELITMAVQLAQNCGAACDEDLLRRRYGDIAHALA